MEYVIFYLLGLGSGVALACKRASNQRKYANQIRLLSNGVFARILRVIRGY